jgi:TRAP-type C4-dicarboxylate transport system permease large subunit
MVELTAAHWIYAIFIVIVLITMAMRRETPLICIIASFILAWVITGNLVKAVQAVFNSVTVVFSELLGVVTIISIIVAMAKMLEEVGLAEMMFRPVKSLIKSPGIAFWVMGFVIMIVAWVIWPSPAIALVGALLLPGAIKAGLPPISAGMAISMFGYGCALTTDFIIQGAPGITAKASGIAVGDVMSKSLPMLIVFGVIALPLTYWSARKDIRANAGKSIDWAPFELTPGVVSEREKWVNVAPGFKKIALWIIAVLFALDIVGMLVFKLRGEMRLPCWVAPSV